MGLNLRDFDEAIYLDEGSYAKIYRVRHKTLGYIRAIKRSKKPVTNPDTDKEWNRFRKECRVLLRLGSGAHPNIIKIYDLRLEDNHAIVEMDYIDGDTLHDYIEKTKFLPFHEVWKFINQIVGAMAYCHFDIYKVLAQPKEGLIPDPENGRRFIASNPEKEKELIARYGVCHNDLHANNIMRRSFDDSYILLDFGLAIQNNEHVNSTDKGNGSIYYKAPEKSDDKEPDFRSDVYSLGVLLFKVLTGVVPFTVRDNKEKDIFSIRKQAYEEINANSSYIRDYPEAFDTIISKCLELNPDNRYANAKELLEALKEAYSTFDETKHLENINVKLSNQLTLAYDRISDLDTSAIEQEKKISTLSSELESSRNEAQQIEKELKTNKSAIRKWRILSILLPLIVLAFSVALYGTTGSKGNDNNLGRVAVVDSTISNVGDKEIIERVIYDTIQVTKHDTIKITQKDTVKIKVPVTETKIEYRTPQTVQNELNQLRKENTNLKTQVQYERVRADRAVELARKLSK